MNRTRDAGFVNYVLNHPDVLPWASLPWQDHIDCSEFIQDERNIVLSTRGGCFIFSYQEPGLYEVHTQFLPEFRGKNVFDASQEALKWMFLGTPECMEILTRISIKNPAHKLPEALGFTLDFQRPSWPTKKGFEDALHYRLSIWDWLRNQTALSEVGRSFHEQLLEGKAQLGVTEPQHPEEEVHNIRVGAALEMARRGQPHKAVWAYNRWARFAQYEQVILMSVDPVIVDIKEAIVKINKNNIEVLSCRQAQQ